MRVSICHFFWSTLSHQFTSIITGLWADVEHMVSTFYKIEVVLDDHHGVALVHQLL
ncbi:MAG: hypothetical protein UW76_C0018G0018 [Parcubacteria group bacterium GW2011_GWF2_44_8b]|nr:MAG: hypothetical protein UW76_C0018G0018 [Parcubacteria group bacterium GW2011_GWF2_44_8b]